MLTLFFSACSSDIPEEEKEKVEIKKTENKTVLETEKAKAEVGENEIKVETDRGTLKVDGNSVEVKTEYGEYNANVSLGEGDDEGKIIVDNQDAEIKIDSNEKSIEVKLKNASDYGEMPEGLSEDQWCIAGNTYEVEIEEGEVVSEITGMVDFKEGRYCHAISNTKAGEMDIVTNYYFTYGGEDVWAVVKIANQETEIHITK
ncbi:MAG: hypothetical protein KC589_04015 [Nanoarchaeota archaeon]|nr:hypothetical protein [Nanoarchaeota archaeon]